MRHALRNKLKIKETYGQDMLDRMIQSLDKVFKSGKLDMYKPEDEKYSIILVDDLGHSENIFEFYILGITYDVHRLAFKGFIG